MTIQEQLHQWQELAQQLRVDSIRATTVAGSGHPTSSNGITSSSISGYIRVR